MSEGGKDGRRKGERDGGGKETEGRGEKRRGKGGKEEEVK